MINTLSNLLFSKEARHEDLNAVKFSFSVTANRPNASTAAFLAAQSPLLKNSTKQFTNKLNEFRFKPVPPAPAILPITHNKAGFALKPSDFTNFKTLGNSFCNLSGSGSGAASIAADKHNAEPICEF
ncbi:hypothetical protein HanRHA438_Chr17g0840961 [Helianthus annuus]|nr:hypothetical protein HanRHA438_Chr17g0840961 [Helianthus annuus]